MANLGLTVRDDPPRVIDVDARAWGEPVDGFVVSIQRITGTLSVVLRNVGSSARTLNIPTWLSFFKIEIEAALTPFGRELSKREPQFINPTIGPGELVETQIPLGSLFLLKPNERYRIQVSCTLPGGQTLHSNTISTE